MANVDDENRDFEDLALPGDEPSELGPLAELDPAEDDQLVSADEAPLKAESPADEDQKADLEEDATQEETKEKGGLLKLLGRANPYTVMLGVVLLVILTAVTCLLLELNSYHFDMGASDYQQRAE